ncbi:tyrosine-type recombinase/integrase [Nitratifractor salsuginis]|uniref:Integrase family protein n=1 Tax=Nitratifractor salsuginis (strain DSM 16511 / JCM 12458 / E9I37-1) TaxID=749222 RepID=E6WZ47_NITSE|nr:integrase arm-type DNA-binding domain-containing protein [Nitratifractor salsuginis]ADV45497.1 integrase family protein [Nitratifractor salsuginis DSM 16511]
MARRTAPLTATEIKAAKPREKPYKLFDGGGLYLLVSGSGGKLWYQKYRFNGKEKKIALGAYPAVSLRSARVKREEIKKMIANGVDPSEERKAKKARSRQDEAKRENTFYNISQKWLEDYRRHVSENYHTRLGRALKNYIYPTIKEQPIDEVTRLDVIAILEELKNRELYETARRTAMLLNKVFKYAVTHEYTPHNIITDIEIKEILGKKVKRHYPTITKEKDIRGLLAAIDGYTGDYFTRMALKVLPYVFVRSYNIRHMEWSEIDFEAKEWIIPAHKMKTKTSFVLPLPHQVVTLLEEVRENSLSNRYVFPSFRSDGKPLSDNTLISALRRMGYSKDEFVPHSFRAMFSTIAYEYANKRDGHGYTGEVIEACLAHKEPNAIKDSYNRASYKEPMRGLMQWYADYLDGVRYEK